MSLKLGDRVKIHIDRLAIGGRGVGRLAGDTADPPSRGIVVFVDGAAPDEDLEVEITNLKKSFAEAKLVRVIEPSPFRIQTPCAIADRCGGCSWQHINYAQQLVQKRALVEEALRKFSGFTNFEVDPVVASPSEFRYRNRIQVHRRDSLLGFHARGTHDIIDATDCLITEEDLTKKFSELRVNTMDEGDRVQIYRDQAGSVRLSGAGNFSDALGFSQVNSAQNKNLVNFVVHAFKNQPAFDFLLDLYSGSGNFTFPLGGEFKSAKIQAVELSPASVKAGSEQVRTQGITNIQFFEAKVETFLQKFRPIKGSSFSILLDPPRTGCGEGLIKEILKQKPTSLIYVSCHPVTLARDIRPLQQAGWELSPVQPFDMFPQTDHVETVAILSPPTKV